MIKLLLCLSFIFFATTAPVAYAVDAAAAIVIEAKTGTILFEQNASTQLSMASTTKIMTALLTLEQPNVTEMFEVDSTAIMVEGSSMGLVAGDFVSLYALAGGMLTASGNDAANAAAVKIAGSNQDFALLMNQRAASIGMENTNFVTPSGLDDDLHYSTAYDMALLAREALQNSDFAELCGSTSARLHYGNPPYDRTLSNHNKLLSYYTYCIGVKTGYTKKSGRCLVSAAEKDGVTLIVVTLNCGDDWNIHQSLYEQNFPKVSTQSIPAQDITLPVTGGTATSTTASTSGQFDYICIENTVQNVESYIIADNFLYAPIKEGDKVGEIVYYINGELYATEDMIANQPVNLQPATKQSLWQSSKYWLYEMEFLAKEKYQQWFG